jgi:hypothetical protein
MPEVETQCTHCGISEQAHWCNERDHAFTREAELLEDLMQAGETVDETAYRLDCEMFGPDDQELTEEAEVHHELSAAPQ